MKRIVSVISLTLGILAAGPAAADDFFTTCMASPPIDLPPNATPGDQFCGCVAKETAGNDNLRAEFLASFKIKEMMKRGASMSNSGRAVAMKCSAH